MDDKAIRRENVVWTVSEDYSFVPEFGIFDRYSDEKINFYKSMLLGYVYKRIDVDELLEFLSINIPKTDLKREFLKLIELFLDDCFGVELSKERPGAISYRKYYYSSVIENYADVEDLKVYEELEFVYCSRMSGKYVVKREVTDELITYLRSNNKNKSTSEIIENLNACFLKYFYKNYRNSNPDEIRKNQLDFNEEKKEVVSESNNQDNNEKRYEFSKRKKINRENTSGLIDIFTIESAEFTKDISEDIKIDDERLRQDDKNNKTTTDEDKLNLMIESRYGELYCSRAEIEMIENEICQGIHKGIKFHLTEGKFIEGKYDIYYANSIRKQKEKNLEYYKDNELIYRRAINELKEILRKCFISDEDDNSHYSDNGRLIPNRIWRKKYLCNKNEKIFMKDYLHETSSISVDILLDSSASQLEREEVISSQAFVIAEALTSLNIPTRVMGFCNFFNYSIITKYRDYNDSPIYNSNIFNFKASGSNRDGLTIKLISKQMDALEVDKKILIVLSDGSPNDKINLGTKGFIKLDAKDYVDELAIKDTAQEVFNLKLENKNCIGVFTGEEDSLKDEIRIYGKDFAYIKDINRFSQVIGFYLEQIALL